MLVYCRTGVRSAEAARKLEALGYREIYDFGGIMAGPTPPSTAANQPKAAFPKASSPLA